MKRKGNLTQELVSRENVLLAIQEVNRTHRTSRHHKPNRCVLWVERTLEDRIAELQAILSGEFIPAPARHRTLYDKSSGKVREISEPKLWPDQYVHHALIQVISPVIMKSLDYWSCGSIPGRGQMRGIKGIKKWMKCDPKGTKYCAQMDIRHFYQSLTPAVVMARMERLIKDKHVLDIIRATLKDGVPIGTYCSQWYANAVLEPLDKLIREQDRVFHYVRYMDNLTVFGPNKKKLHRVVRAVNEWLHAHGMELKGDWQVFPTDKRMPDAMGFRYGSGWSIPRKRNVLRFKRACKRVRKKLKSGKAIPATQASGIISRIGGFSHSDATNIVRKGIRSIGYLTLRNIVSNAARQRNV